VVEFSYTTSNPEAVMVKFTYTFFTFVTVFSSVGLSEFTDLAVVTLRRVPVLFCRLCLKNLVISQVTGIISHGKE
jgi:hypothetical protein